jgi:hypothetical protein
MEKADIILEEAEPEGEFSLLDIVDNQLSVILHLVDLDTSVYDKMEEHRIKALSLALRVIIKTQAKLLDNI